jgi:hypothetical protein
MKLRLLVSVLDAWPLERTGMAKTDIVEVAAILSRYQVGNDQHGFWFAIKRVESGMI